MLATIYRGASRAKPAWIRVAPNPEARCRAVAALVRPDEVAHLVDRVPAHYLPSRHAFGTEVARWLRERLAAQDLMYCPDPACCDIWYSPRATLERGCGDCEDLGILSAALLLAGGAVCDVVLGELRTDRARMGHAWVEGTDESGWFLLEATSSQIWRGNRPSIYRPALFARPGMCRWAA